MTKYAYKLVSVNLGDQLDWRSIEKARKRGWEPVPLGEEPVPAVNPLDMTPDELANFKLCRMPLDQQQQITKDIELLNAALADPRVQRRIAVRNTPGWVEENTEDDEDAEDAELQKRVEVAYAWLHARGLA